MLTSYEQYARLAAFTAGLPSLPERSVQHRTVGRNDPCSCGSGKKFKKCHGSARGANA